MDTALLVAIITATASVLSWVINSIFTSWKEKRKEKFEARLEFIDKQLEELYGPLAFLVHEGEHSFKSIFRTNRRRWVSLRGDKPIPEEQLALWIFWVENDFFPRNEKIKQLLMEKTHLIEGSKVPESFLHFMEHYNTWKLEHQRWKEEGIEYSFLSRVKFPEDFNDEVLTTFKSLKKEQNKFLDKIYEKKMKSQSSRI
ncbi:MAG: hypothetical protein GF308_20220 [Candidatus Heimdallarchaeota archaeon]|nr:hypothetical protein [Candidatus Heimdallarchaeota archaeon]